MNSQGKIHLTEIDRESWSFILYESTNGDLYGDFIYNPISFVDASIFIRLSDSETKKVNESRDELIKLAATIRYHYSKYLDQNIDQQQFECIRRPNYNIKSIDLSKVSAIEDLHLLLKIKLHLPESYTMDWNAFKEVIYEVERLPTNIIFYGYHSFEERFSEDANTLRSIIFAFNKTSNKSQFYLDYNKGLPKEVDLSNPSWLLHHRPFQYGLRGDQPLWNELEEAFKHLHYPKTKDELVTQIHSSIEKLTQNKLLESDSFFVDKYNKGGMSGGYVSSSFWLNSAIPMIVGRYRVMKEGL